MFPKIELHTHWAPPLTPARSPGRPRCAGSWEALHADRIRYGFRAEEDPGLIRELAGRGDQARRWGFDWETAGLG